MRCGISITQGGKFFAKEHPDPKPNPNPKPNPDPNSNPDPNPDPSPTPEQGQHQPSFLDAANPARLCVENPLDPSVDCGAPAWNISQLRHACCNSYMRLLNLVGASGGGGSAGLGGGGLGGGGGRLRVLGVLLDVRDASTPAAPAHGAPPKPVEPRPSPRWPQAHRAVPVAEPC